MRFLLDTNLIYQLFGYHNNKKNVQDFDIEQLYNDILNGSDKYFVSNYNFEEIVTKADRTKVHKQTLIKFLRDLKIDIIYIDRAVVKEFYIDNYCDLNEQEFNNLLDYFMKDKINIEVEEFGELLAVVFEYVKIAYGVLMELYFKEKGFYSNINILLKNLVDNQKIGIINKIKNEFKIQLIQSYEKEKFKNLLSIVIKQLINELNGLFINENVYTNQFIQNEIKIQSKFSTNILEYISNMSCRVNKKDKSINLIEHVKNRYCDELRSLKYIDPYIQYYGYFLTKVLSNSNFDKNDFIDSLLFRFVSDDLFLITREIRMQNMLLNINIKNYELLCKYLRRKS